MERTGDVMRKLLATSVLIGALLGAPGTALATDRCDPAVLADRARVFAEFAERGIRIAGVTGAGGIAEFSSRADARRYACPTAAAMPRIAGVNGAGGVTVR
jgi:hypothetical protein